MREGTTEGYTVMNSEHFYSFSMQGKMEHRMKERNLNTLLEK